jgi:hypothetical protein
MNYIPNAFRTEGDPQILESGPSSLTPTDQLARFLGWFSIGLGLTELFAGGALARSLGLEGKSGLMRLFGARELGAGFATLSVDKKAGLYSRVAGDALDILALVTAITGDSHPRQKDNAKLALFAVLGVTALDIICARAVTTEGARPAVAPRTYADRSGFPKGVEASRKIAADASSRLRAKSTAATA